MNDDEKSKSGMTDMLKSVLQEYRKTLFTATPGIIVSYDASTRRANVQPTPRTAFRDGTYGAPPILPNVPVLMPSGGGFIVSVPLQAGDPVLLVFCQRGIGAFKKTFQQENPSGGVLEMDAAVALAGFGPLQITPASGLSVQTTDGSKRVTVTNEVVEVKVGEAGGATFYPDGSVDFENGASTDAFGDFITAKGISLDNHVHGNVQTGAGTTGIPQ